MPSPAATTDGTRPPGGSSSAHAANDDARPGAQTDATPHAGAGTGHGAETTPSQPPTPLWRQVLEDLERRLASGEISDRFPTDRELGEYYDVSRHTVRQAVGRLTARGIIERQRGRGSTVAQPGLLQEPGTVYSLYRAVEATGAVQTSDLLGIEQCRDPEVAARLGLDDDAELVRLERLRRVDGEPLALDTAWLPFDIGAPLMEVDFGHTALYDELRTRVGVAPTSGREVITPVLPDADLRAMLDLDDDEGVLRILRTSAHRDRPIECRITLIRGSRFAMVSRWPGPTTTEVEVTLPESTTDGR